MRYIILISVVILLALFTFCSGYEVNDELGTVTIELHEIHDRVSISVVKEIVGGVSGFSKERNITIECSDILLDTLTHETVHYTQFVTKLKKLEGNEISAYITGYVVGKAYPIIQEKCK